MDKLNGFECKCGTWRLEVKIFVITFKINTISYTIKHATSVVQDEDNTLTVDIMFRSIMCRQERKASKGEEDLSVHSSVEKLYKNYPYKSINALPVRNLELLRQSHC